MSNLPTLVLLLGVLDVLRRQFLEGALAALRLRRA
jgi:hypothetical protein